MAINKKLITFAKEADFLGAKNGIGDATTGKPLTKATNGFWNNIPSYSIVFIKETGEIWHNGTYFPRKLTDVIESITEGKAGFVYRTETEKFLTRPLSLWGNTITDEELVTNGSLTVGDKLMYKEDGIAYVNSTTNIIGFNDKIVSIPATSLIISGGDLIVNSGGYPVFKVGVSEKNISSTYPLTAAYFLNTTSYFKDTATVGKTWNSIKQYTSDSAHHSLASELPAIINIDASECTADWKPWIASGDAAAQSSWGIGLGKDDAFYIGRIGKEEQENSLTQSWKFCSDGTLEAKKLKLSGDSTKFLKGDGSEGLIEETVENPWILDYSPTSITFNGDWINAGIDFSSMSTGIYLLCIEDVGVLYSGVFSYYSGTINTDEEILLHACGTRQSYTDNGTSYKEGIIYAKIKPDSNNKASLWLAHNQHITSNKLTIKIKKLAIL